MAALKETIMRLAEPLIRAQGLEPWGLELVEGGRMVVRLFLDVPVPANGAEADPGDDEAISPALSATISQCEHVSRHLGLALEAEDVMPGAYVLEVSSPGLSRMFFTLGQMRPYVGDVVEARLHTAVAPEGAEGPRAMPRKTWRGRLLEVGGQDFVLAPVEIGEDGDVADEDMPPVRIGWQAVRRANRLHVFAKPAKPGKQPRKGQRPGAGASSIRRPAANGGENES